MSENRDYTAQNQSLLDRWSRDLDRKRAKAEASEESFKKTFADTIRQANHKKALAREARQSVDRQKSGVSNPLLDKVAASEHLFVDDDEVITGEEPRPWEDY